MKFGAIFTNKTSFQWICTIFHRFWLLFFRFHDNFRFKQEATTQSPSQPSESAEKEMRSVDL